MWFVKKFCLEKVLVRISYGNFTKQKSKMQIHY